MEEAIQQGIVLLVCKKLAKGSTPTEIAEALEEPESLINALCEKAEAYAPEFDEEKIRENWNRQP